MRTPLSSIQLKLSAVIFAIAALLVGTTVASVLVQQSAYLHRAGVSGVTGTAVPELGLERANRERASTQRLALVAGGLAIGIGAVAAWLVGRSLARRLQKIADATRAEHTRELNATVERYRTLVEKTHAVPWELEPGTFSVAYISPQVELLLGRPASDFTGGHYTKLVHPEDHERVMELLTGLTGATEARNVDLEYRLLDARGQGVYVRSAVSTDASSPGVPGKLRGISFDVTQQRKMEIELRQAQKLESVGRLAAGVAHEINTPVQFVSDSVHFVRDAAADLVNLIGRYRTLRESIGSDPSLQAISQELARYEEEIDLAYLLENIPLALDRSLEGLGRVAVIVRSMKEFAHPEPREMAPVDLNRAIESTLTIARNEYRYVADVETDFGELPLVFCHSGDVNQALLNIIVNAAHAIGDRIKGTESRGTIAVRTRQEGPNAVVSIHDTGGGISPRIRDQIFDPFFTTKEVGKGTGQGLSVARSVVVEKHGGELSLETEEGVSTTFFIRLPIDGVRAAPRAAE